MNQKTHYIIKKRQGAQSLLFYGCEHTSDPNHPQFQDIKYRLNSFLLEAKNPVILVEGHFDKVPISETVERSKSIIQGGEAQFVVHLAREKKIIVVSPEPSRVWEANQLAKEFARDVIVFYYFIRQISWWNGFKKKPNMQIEAEKMLKLMEESFNWVGVGFSVEAMDKINQGLFSKPLSFKNTQWLHNAVNPTLTKHVINKIACRSSELRDEYIIMQIEEYWHGGKSPFIVFGVGHARSLELAILKLSNR